MLHTLTPYAAMLPLSMLMPLRLCCHVADAAAIRLCRAPCIATCYAAMMRAYAAFYYYTRHAARLLT